MITKEQILNTLKNIINPETEKNLVDSGMVKEVEVEGDNIKLTIELSHPNSPIKGSLERVINEAIHAEISDKAKISVDFTGKKITTQTVKIKPVDHPFPKVKNIIAVASGKGGVGKSTVAVNLAIGLAKLGNRVAILDTDIFGPSIPKMFGVEDERPSVRKVNGKDTIFPIEKYGLKMLSIGFFVDEEQALIWRGSMATNALKQLILDTEWGELDYVILDLPPGTSDIHLTIVQTVAVTGAIIVTTPQDVALADAKKAISMFRSEKIEVPILGIVENMSWFTPAELPDNKYYIFGKGGAQKVADMYNVPVLGQIPIVQSIRENGDAGKPSALNEESIDGKAFIELAEKVMERVEERNKTMAPTQKVEIDPNASCSV